VPAQRVAAGSASQVRDQKDRYGACILKIGPVPGTYHKIERAKRWDFVTPSSGLRVEG